MRLREVLFSRFLGLPFDFSGFRGAVVTAGADAVWGDGCGKAFVGFLTVHLILQTRIPPFTLRMANFQPVLRWAWARQLVRLFMASGFS